MFEDGKLDLDLAVLAGKLDETGSRWEPYRLLDPSGEPVRAVAEFFVDLQARGRSQSTVRSYGMDLLRWFRFCWATETPWDRATRVEARDFCRWMLVAGKPDRPHWRSRKEPKAATSSGNAYAPSVRAHCETVLRSFYDYHLDAGTGPVINPFPLDRSRRAGRANAHHNPMEPFRKTAMPPGNCWQDRPSPRLRRRPAVITGSGRGCCWTGSPTSQETSGRTGGWPAALTRPGTRGGR